MRAELASVDEIPSPTEWQEFAPVIDRFLKEHLFANIFARDALDGQTRELATIAALANMTGTAGQLELHFGGAMNTGFSRAQMHDLIEVPRDSVGHMQAEEANEVLTTVLRERN